MKPTGSHLFRATLLFGAALLLTARVLAADVTEKIQLLPAKDLGAFYSWIEQQGVNKDPNQVFTLQDGVLRVAGTAKGYVATKLEYSNYRLVAEYKWGKTAPDNDSGIFVHCIGPDKAWMTSLEINLATKPKDHSGDLVLLGGPTVKIKVNGEVKKGFSYLRRRGEINYEKPVGEWNTLEILCDGGKLQVSINGKVTLEGTDAEPHAGKIFLQSNKGEIFFGKCELHPLK